MHKNNSFSDSYGNFIYFIYIYIALVDVVTIRFFSTGILGTELWMVSYLFFGVFFIKSVAVIIRNLVSAKYLISITTAIVIMMIVFLNIFNPKNLSSEATIEIDCALDHFSNTIDAGFMQTCLHGYPARQFFLPMLVPLFFGRTQINLNLGMSLYFFIGMTFFLAGGMSFMKKAKYEDYIFATIISFIFHIYYFNNAIFGYEQSVIPFCFGLMLCGLFLHYQNNNSKEIIALIGLTIYYLVSSYTPSLALVFIACSVALYYLSSRKKIVTEKKLILIIFFVSLSVLYVSFFYRGDLQVANSNRSLIQLQSDIGKGFEHIISRTLPHPFVSYYFHYIFLIFTAVTLFLFFGWKQALIVFWLLITIIAAIISKGYDYYDVDIRLQRAIVIFPVLFTLMLFVIKKNYLKLLHWLGTRKEFFFICFFLLTFSTGILFQVRHIKEKDNLDTNLLMGNWLKGDIVSANTDSVNYIFVDSKILVLDIELNYLVNTLNYFIPNVKTQFLSKRCEQLDYIQPDINYFIITSEIAQSECLKDNYGRLKLLKSYSVSPEINLRFYKLNGDS